MEAVLNKKSPEIKCPLCFSSNIELIHIGYTMFRHLDFTDVKKSGSIGRCTRCQLLFNIVSEDDISKLNNLFQSQEYSASKQTKHTLIVNQYKNPVTRSFLQAELIRKLLSKLDPSILDIGCFNGELLIELYRRFKSADLHGFDVNKYLSSTFPKEKKFHLWLSDLRNVQGKFDLICISHSIMCIKDIHFLFEQIKRLMKPDGIIYIQVPDICRNHFSILMADQYYYYTPNILKNIFNHFNFKFLLLKNEWFPREIVGVAKSNSGKASTGYPQDLQIYDCIKHFDKLFDRLRKIKITASIGTLGTTNNAAFVDTILGERNYFFVDENPNRVGTMFRHKKVIHPKILKDSYFVILPYGSSGQRILKRFRKQYKGRFMCV